MKRSYLVDSMLSGKAAAEQSVLTSSSTPSINNASVLNSSFTSQRRTSSSLAPTTGSGYTSLGLFGSASSQVTSQPIYQVQETSQQSQYTSSASSYNLQQTEHSASASRNTYPSQSEDENEEVEDMLVDNMEKKEISNEEFDQTQMEEEGTSEKSDIFDDDNELEIVRAQGIIQGYNARRDLIKRENTFFCKGHEINLDKDFNVSSREHIKEVYKKKYKNCQPVTGQKPSKVGPR